MNEGQAYQQLPLEARNILDFQSHGVQDQVLSIVRDLMENWQDSGAELDPIQWDLILNGLVEVLVGLTSELRDEKTIVNMMLGVDPG